MFKRRKKLTLFQHAREMIWPSMGWRRMGRYIRLRITRLSDSARSIALALAIGVGVGFSPLIGTHFPQVIFLAWMFRVNIMVALVGNCIANPWTFPFIWWASIKFGAFLVSAFGIHTKTAALPPHLDLSHLWHIMTHEPVRIFLPWMLGGHVLGILAALISYPIFYRVVKAAKTARSRAKLYKIHQMAREVTAEHKSKSARH